MTDPGWGQANDPRRHPTRWRTTKLWARQLTNDRCVRCLNKASAVHHAFYGLWLLGILFLPIAGVELPGWQVFPLCDRCHSNRPGCAHNLKNYRISRRSRWLNHNTLIYTWYLRLCFLRTQAWVYQVVAVLVIAGLLGTLLNR